MIKKIIACSDIHIKNFKNLEETSNVLQTFIDECKKITNEYKSDEVRIVIAGDIFHSKIEVSNEAMTIAGWFLRELDKITKTIVICGNHDTLLNNISRIDSLTPIFSLSRFKNCLYLDKELNYSSGCLVDDNVVWCLFSSFDAFNKPNINEFKEKYPNNTFIGIAHCDINGALTDTGHLSENGMNADYFGDLDFVILGHIHKRQCIKKNGVPLVYCGSLIQQHYGENISGHGYVVWNVDDKSYTQHDIPNTEYGFYKFSITDISDIENDKEDLINL